MDRPAVRDAALLIFRLVVGIVFVAHGYDNLFLSGMTETTAVLAAAEVPQPDLVAWAGTLIALIGGAVLVIGLLTSYVSAALVLVAVVETYFLHLDSGFFVADGGFEYAIVLVAALLMFIVFGPGRASVDGVLTRA